MSLHTNCISSILDIEFSYTKLSRHHFFFFSFSKHTLRRDTINVILRVQRFVVITLCMHNATSANRIRTAVVHVYECVCMRKTHIHKSIWIRWWYTLNAIVLLSVNRSFVTCVSVCMYVCKRWKNKERQTKTHKSPFVKRYHQLKAEHVSSRLHTKRKNLFFFVSF